MSSFFDFDTPEKKRKGLAWAFALWLFCSTNVGLFPSDSPFSFSLDMFRMLGWVLQNFSAAAFCLVWLFIVGNTARFFLKTEGKHCKMYFSLLLILVTLLNIPHPWLADIFFWCIKTGIINLG